MQTFKPVLYEILILTSLVVIRKHVKVILLEQIMKIILQMVKKITMTMITKMMKMMNLSREVGIVQSASVNRLQIRRYCTTACTKETDFLVNESMLLLIPISVGCFVLPNAFYIPRHKGSYEIHLKNINGHFQNVFTYINLKAKF